jgi:hypothetical protein
MDFVADCLATGPMVLILSVIDAYTRECMALEADFGLGSGRVTRVLEQANRRSPSAAGPRPHARTMARSSRRGAC